MNPRTAWYVARASGIVAWLLISASVVWGLALSGRVTRRPRPAWVLDLHRFLGGLAVAFSLVHVGGIVADNSVHFGWTATLVPFASSWRPVGVALGIVGLYVLIAVELTSLMMRRLPRRAWHLVHLTSYLAFWSTTLHGVAAGHDAHVTAWRWVPVAASVVVAALTMYRVGRGVLSSMRVAKPQPMP